LCSCLDIEPPEDFSQCDRNSLNFFEPTNKTFIPPAQSNFIDTMCLNLELDEDLFYNDLNATKICQLEQQMGMISNYLSNELCGASVSIEDLDSYYYQYVGLTIDPQESIFVNAFKPDLLDSLDWKSEPFVGNCSNGINHWSVLYNLAESNFEQYRSNLSRQIFFKADFPNPDSGCGRCIGISDLETFKLDHRDICVLQTHFHKLGDIKSEGCYLTGRMVDLSRDWLLQYVGAKKNDSRWIYINAIHGSRYDGSEEWFYLDLFLPEICGGGLTLWGVFFDLDSKEFIDLQFNPSR